MISKTIFAPGCWPGYLISQGFAATIPWQKLKHKTICWGPLADDYPTITLLSSGGGTAHHLSALIQAIHQETRNCYRIGLHLSTFQDKNPFSGVSFLEKKSRVDVILSSRVIVSWIVSLEGGVGMLLFPLSMKLRWKWNCAKFQSTPAVSRKACEQQ